MLILQHRREKFHRFNTARIVARALAKSELLAGRPAELAAALRLAPRAGLLYPGPGAVSLEGLPAEARPEQLVILDGTWSHAKSLLRELPALRALPRFALSPTAPSRYRIRREPTAEALSTVEATVAALKLLEPETEGLEELLRAFDGMIDAQLAHPGSVVGARFQKRSGRTWKNVPRAMVEDLGNIVVAYGEAQAGERGRKRADEPPLTWAAERLGDGERFSCTLTPTRPIDAIFLQHAELSQADFAAAVSLEEARRRWAEFSRPTDIVAVFQPGTARLLTFLASDAACLTLKSVAIDALRAAPTLEAALERERIPPPLPTVPGRTGKRLAAMAALVRHVSDVARRSLADAASAPVELY